MPPRQGTRRREPATATSGPAWPRYEGWLPTGSVRAWCPQRLRVAQVPAPARRTTSYLTLLAGALKRAGVEVVTPDVAELWRLGWARSVDLVHLHWLEFIAPSAPLGMAGLARTLIRHMRFVVLLGWLRFRGITLVWTVHNLGPHEPVRPRMESLLSLVVSRISHALVAHSAYARDRSTSDGAARSTWRSSRMATMSGGSPGRATRPELRGALTIPDDAYVFWPSAKCARTSASPTWSGPSGL